MARAARQQSKSAKTRTTRPSKNSGGLEFTKLRRYNFLVALLFLVQGVLVLILSDPVKGLQSITASFLTEDKLASSASGQQVLVSGVHTLFDLNIAYVVAAFFFISALAHLIIATWKRKVYESDLSRGVNRSRWIQYSVSGGVMLVAIAILSGVFDFASLLMIFALTAIMSLLAMVMELRNLEAKQVDWANYTISVTAGTVPWLVIAIYVWYSHVYGSGVPGYVYWIVGSLFILTVGSAINMYLQYKKLGRWSTYLYGERAYILLSLVAETALAWQIFAGTLR